MPIEQQSFNYISELSRDLKSRLEEYLRLHGREIANNGTFRCLMTQNHARGDADFSASITRKSNGEKVWYCHVCHEGGSIFELAHLVEGYTITGKGFVKTVIELATKLGVPLDKERLPKGLDTDTEIDPYTMVDLYREIEAYVASKGNGEAHLMSGEFGRAYSKEHAEAACKLVPIGCVSAKALTAHMISKFGEEKVRELPFYEQDDKLLAPYVFSSDRLVVTTRDRMGRPVSFSGRAKESLCSKDLPKEQRISKYLHTKGFEGIKKSTLFLLNEAKAHIAESHKVFIVEGQFDTIAMHLAGKKNTVGVLGSSLSTDALDKLMPYKVYVILFAMDPDQAGIGAIRKGLELLRYYDAVAEAIPMPSGEDPDKLLREGNTDFLEHPEDAIKLVLQRDKMFHDPSVPVDIRYKRMIDFVVNTCPHSAKYRTYATVISAITGYHEEDIIGNLNHYLEGGALVSAEEKRAMTKIFEVSNRPVMEKIMTIEDSLSKLRELAAGSQNEDARTTWHDFLALVNGEEKFPTVLKTGIDPLDRACDIECGALTFVGGFPSNGKSSVLRYITLNMLANYPDLYVLYVSTDDNKKSAMASFLAMMTSIPKKQVRAQIDSKTFMEQPKVSSSLDQLHKVFQTQLELRGLDTCYSTATIRQRAERIRAFHKGSFLIVVDAMNNLNDIRKEDQRIGIENAIRDFKNMAVTYDAAVIPVTHLVKTSTDNNGKTYRPKLKDLKGTSFIEFEAKTILLVYMDMHYKKDTQLKWRQPGITMGESFPVIEVTVGKDKDNPAGDIIPLHFDPTVGTLYVPTESQLRNYKKLIEQGGKSNEGKSTRQAGPDAGIGEDL